MANYTEHYHLHQWEPEDSFLRTDFNEDLATLDAALKQLDTDLGALVVFGSYTGDDTEERDINLGFAPAAVYSCTDSGIAGTVESYHYTYGGLAFSGRPVTSSKESVIALTASGFHISTPHSDARANRSGQTYHYAALRK
ncbi:hypothetical protein [Flavonifractor hominis]|uniref:Uncharacterized protein n=1 Tax=Flavonifractor hominis TaxID=3133178 RepID=A0ABV1EQH3_9FIRM